MSSYTTLFTRLSTQLMRGRALVRLLAHAHVRQLLRSVFPQPRRSLHCSPPRMHAHTRSKIVEEHCCRF